MRKIETQCVTDAIILHKCPLLVSTAGLPLTLFNPTVFGCWIAPYPLSCMDDPEIECQRGNNAELYRWIFFFAPQWTVVICITFLMVLLTLSVKKEEKDVISMKRDEERRQQLDDDFNDKSRNVNRPQFVKEASIKLQRTKQMLHQALLYVGVFYLTWTLPTVGTLIKTDADKPIPFFILAMVNFLVPLQGFWNWLVYRRGPCLP